MIMNTKKEYFKPELVAMELYTMNCLMVSGFDDSTPMPHPGAPARSGAMRNTLIEP